MSPALPTRLSPANTLPARISAWALVRLSARPRATSNWSARTLAGTIFLLPFGNALAELAAGLGLGGRRRRRSHPAGRSIYLEAETEEDRQMVGSDVRQQVDLHQLEMRRDEQMVERPAQQRIVGVERRIEAAPDPRVRHACNLAEQARCPRPADIVKVAHDDRCPPFVADRAA